MEISLKTIVIVSMVVVFLLVLSFFINIESGRSVKTTDYSRTFNALCQSYKSSQCSWDVTRDTSFVQFMDACKQLYGSEREAFSCLYTYCQACRSTGAADLRCSSVCEQCRADSSIGVRSVCCQQFASQCGNSAVTCGDVCVS